MSAREPFSMTVTYRQIVGREEFRKASIAYAEFFGLYRLGEYLANLDVDFWLNPTEDDLAVLRKRQNEWMARRERGV